MTTDALADPLDLGGTKPPLHGTRVIELANVISGPYAGMILFDLGADLVKIELPGSGDPFRVWDARSQESSAAFNSLNRGKRSAAIDIRSEAGRRSLTALINKADVVIENFRPGFLAGLGLGYEDVAFSNPLVVYCSIRGMGASDRQPVYDAIAQGRSGLWSQFTDMKQPAANGPALADHLAGMQCALGVLAALLQRSRSGKGCYLQVSMLGACMSIQEIEFGAYFATGSVADNRSRPRASQSYAFLCADGLPIAIHLSSGEKFWANLISVLDASHLGNDERFSDRTARSEHYDELHAVLAVIFTSRPRKAWLDLLSNADVPVAPILTVGEAAQDEFVKSLNVFQRHGDATRSFHGVTLPVSGFAAPDRSRAVPFVGEHTDEILAEVSDPDLVHRSGYTA